MTQTEKAKICGTCKYWHLTKMMKDTDKEDNWIVIGYCKPRNEHVSYHNALDKGCMYYERMSEHKLHKL